MSIKRIDISEFRSLGYLQELNRRFLHPLGLALEVIVDKETKRESLGGVWDYRDDPEGMIYDIKNLNEEEQKEMALKSIFIDSELLKKEDERKKLFGSIIEPL